MQKSWERVQATGDFALYPAEVLDSAPSPQAGAPLPTRKAKIEDQGPLEPGLLCGGRNLSVTSRREIL